MQTKIALITGATAGIGWATALRLANEGFAIIACGRRQHKLDELEQIIPSGVAFYKLLFDVSDFDGANRAIHSLPSEFQKIDLLVNNAGNAHGLAEFHESDIADSHAMVASNILGPINISRLISPDMVARGSGHIINISSIAGKENYPRAAVYCASKAAMESFTKGLRIDLAPYGVKVSSIAPGAVETEFSEVRFKGDQERAIAVYDGYIPLTAEDIADTVAYMATAPDHVLHADMMVLPKAQSTAYNIIRNNA